MNLTVRNVICDYYVEKPNGYSRPHLKTSAKVPVIRMFGILETGQKCCMHVHGVFPYIIIRTGLQFTPEYASLLCSKLEAIVLQNYRRPKFNIDFAIYEIKPIIVKSLYGYNKNDEHFVQILCYNSFYARIIANALQQEVKKSAIFQVYESHIPYILQFFIDYSIFGMDTVSFCSVKFRISPQQNYGDLYYRDLKVGDIVNNMDLISPVLPSTVLTVECDVFASNINNKLLNSQKAISSNPGLNYIWQDEKQRCERRGEKLCYESSQKERPYPETEKEQNHIRHLHTYIKSISSNSSCSALEQDVFSVPLGPSTVEKANDFQNDNFETDINIFDEVLFFDDDVVEDGEEINEQEFEEDVDLNTKVTELCKSVSASNDTDLIKSDFNDSDSSSDEDSFSLNTEAPGPSRIEFIKLRKDSKEFSRQSSGSDDLFDRSSKDFETGTASILSCDSDLRNFEQHCHSAVSSKNSSQASNSTRDFTTEYFLNIFQEMSDCARSYETDIESIWIPKRPRNSEPEIIQTEQWLRPCKRLPLRKRVSVPSNEYFCSAEEYTESSLLEPNNCETDDQLFTESSVELSFYDYKHTKARLEQTLISLSETPRSNEEKAGTDIQYLCVMSMEILALTSRGMPVPDPKCDEILGIFYTVFTDVCCQNETDCVNGVLLNMDEAVIAENDSYTFVTSENDLFCSFAKIIQRYDPDIVIGYNTTRYSWGYLIERSLVLGRNLLSEISRYHIDINHYYRPGEQSRIKWIKELDTTPKGRILVNIWRIIRSEVSLRNYTLSNVVNKLLNRRFPQYSFPTLTEWILSNRKDLICLVLHHLQLSCQLNMIVLLRLDFFTKTSEMARLYGIQFNDVFTRGSQFRVESMLLRLAHQQNYVAPSISTLQREMMCSPETLPLTMEPESGYYNDPVIVLDFQSLYPSIIIAYNYCFSTCLGKLLHVTNIDLINKVIEFGGLEYNCPLDDIISMHKKRELHISPTGVIFCKKSVRKGLMPLMLEEILDTRVMVKKAVKKYKDNRLLARTLDARQIALKMVANVTYGYSAANFSGRMPCVEVADAIVSKGRETLERAIHLVNSGNYGNSRVVYGDTDSMFVVCPEATRIEAFDIGRRIADDVTNANPKPVKLKMEKVMHPLILESKKRYVGMSYESATDSEGVFDSKGIETVRRDSCPLVSRILEKVLRLLFSNSVNQMMRYLDVQLSNLSQLALSEFIFSREYRKSYAQSAVVASKLIAEKRKAISLRYEPEVGERVPFVIVSGEPNSTLISCVREPQEFISDRRMTLNFEYYVNRQVLPSLQRALDYVFLKIEWRCPTIVGCYKCRALGTRLWCTKCITDPKALVLALTNYYQEKRLLAKLNNICRHCLSLRSISIDYSKCINMACIVKQKRIFLGRSVTADAVKTHALTDKETFLNFE